MGAVLGSGSALAWGAFGALVLGMLALDLGWFQRVGHEVRPREAVAWSVAWITLSLLFAAGVWTWDGPDAGLEFVTAWLVEKALSVDNLFVFLVTLRYFAVPPAQQHRVLFWGVLGALVMRGAFILAGGVLIHAFHWILYVFGAFLVFTAVRLAFQAEIAPSPERNPVLRLLRRFVPATPGYHGGRFTVREHGRLLATPLLLVVLVVEATDVMFAVDSIPAVFAVTQDVFLVYTSNIFAILGLRALYFLLAGTIGRFRFLRWGLSGVLAFVGFKMLLADWLGGIPVVVSLAVVAVLIAGSIAASLLRPGPAE